MKSVIQIAREINISPQAIYKRFKAHPELIEELQQHITFEGGMKFDAEGETAVKTLFNGKNKEVDNQVEKVVNQPDLVDNSATQVVNLVEMVDNQVESLNDQIINQLHDEIAFLRERLASSESRNHELALRLADLVKNNQALITMLEEEKKVEQPVVNSSKVVDNQVEQPRQGFFERLFRR